MSSLSVKSVLSSCCPRPLRSLWDRVEASELGYRLAKGTFWSLVGAVISRGLMLAALVVVARMLGKSVFGELGIIRSTVVMFGVLAGFGLSLTANKHVAELRQSDPERAGRIVVLSGLAAVGVGGLSALVLFFFAPWLAAHTLAAPHLSGLLRVGCLILLLNALNGAQTGALAGLEAFKAIARVNLFVGLISFPLLIGGTYWAGLEGAVWGLTLCLAINWALNHLALRREAARAGVPLRLTGCTSEWNVLWHFSLPAVLSSAMVGPMQWASRALLVNQPDGYAQMGAFTAAVTFQIMLLFVGNTLNAPLLSMISSTPSRSNEKLDRINILSSWLVGIIPALPLLCFPELAGLLFGEEYRGTSFSRTFCIVILYTTIMLYKQGLARVLAANSMLWWSFVSNLLWAATLLASALFLVRWGALGLAISFLLAYAASTVIFIPLYVAKNLVPRGTIISWHAGLVWLVALIAMTFSLLETSIILRTATFVVASGVVFLTMKRMLVSWGAPPTAEAL